MVEKVLISLSILFLMIGIFYLIRGRKTFLRIFLPLLFLSFSLLFGITGICITGYKNLTKETIIATVRAEKSGNFLLLYTRAPDEEGESIYILKEEKWGVSANFLKWKRYLNFIGFKPLFRLKEIGGYPIYESRLSKWIWSHLMKKGYLYPFVDIAFESSVYSEVFGREVLVKATSSGLTISMK